MLNLWYKDLLYLRSNNPTFILLYVTVLSIFYNLHTYYYPPLPDQAGIYKFRENGENIVRFLGVGICLPPGFVEYEPNEVVRLENLIALNLPDLKFYRSLEAAQHALETNEIEVAARFKKFADNNYDYDLIVKNGVFNSVHYSWHKIHDAQHVVNRLLMLLHDPSALYPQFEYHEPFGDDEIDQSLQANITFLWIYLVPFLFIMIDCWVLEHCSKMLHVLRNEHVKIVKFFVAKCTFFLALFLTVSLIYLIPNWIINWQFLSMKEMLLYPMLIGIYLATTVLLITLFDNSTFYPKLVLIVSSLISECANRNPILLTPTIRTLLRETPNWKGFLIMSTCIWVLIGISIYLEFWRYGSMDTLKWYYPISRGFWRKKQREPKSDPNYKEQNVKIPAKPKDGSKMEFINKTLPATPPKPFIVLNGVCKKIGAIWKLNSITMTIRFDQLTVLYGHIGCGANELMRIVAGEMRAEFGEIAHETTQRAPKICATHEVPCVNYLSVFEYLKYLARLRKTPITSGEINDMLMELKLLEYAGNQLDMLSCTQKERLRICAVFVGRPDVVLIDRPTVDSFPENKCRISKFIEKRKPNRAIIMSTFDPDEAESISDRVVFLSEGYIVLNGPVEVFRQRINSTFEFRVWPLGIFTDKERVAIINVVSVIDKKVADAMRFVESPNGKVRIFIPIEFRKSIPQIFEALCSQVNELQITFIEMSRPTIHDVYENACYDPKQYAPLRNYDELAASYTRQNLKHQTSYFFWLVLRILRDPTTKYIGAILILLYLTTMTYLLVLHFTSWTQAASIEIRNDAGSFDYLRFNGYILPNQVVGDQVVAYLKPSAKLNVQNRVLLAALPDTTTVRVDINSQIRERDAVNAYFGRLAPFQIKNIFRKTAMMLPILAVSQVFAYSMSMLVVASMMRCNLRPTKMLFPWPKYGYYLRLLAVNMSIFGVIQCLTMIILLSLGFLTIPAALVLSVMWILVFLTLLPLIYCLVFYLGFIKSAVLIAISFSAFAVAIPSLVTVYVTDQNVIAFETYLNIIALICWFSPPSSIQVIAAYLTSESIEAQDMVTMCFAAMSYFWMPIGFALLVNSTKLGYFYQLYITTKIWLTSPFQRQSMLRAPYHIKDSFIYATLGAETPPNAGGSREAAESAMPSASAPSRADAGVEAPNCITPSSAEDPAGTSFITKREEDVLGYVSRTSVWWDQQAVEINNNFTLIIGDQSVLKSQLLRAIADCNDQDFRIAYVPREDFLPTILTPIELMETVAAGRGIVMDRAQMAFLLDTFSMFYIANVQIQHLTDAERRTLALVTMIMQKPSMIILDETDMYLPCAKMTTIWSICTRLKENGVAVIFTTSNVQSAEHTATNYAHIYKCQFVAVQACATIKCKLSRIIVEIDLVPDEDAAEALRELQAAFRASQFIATRSETRRALMVPNDDVETIRQLIRELEKNWRKFLRYSLRSTNFEEYVANSLIKT